MFFASQNKKKIKQSYTNGNIQYKTNSRDRYTQWEREKSLQKNRATKQNKSGMEWKHLGFWMGVWDACVQRTKSNIFDIMLWIEMVLPCFFVIVSLCIWNGWFQVNLPLLPFFASATQCFLFIFRFLNKFTLIHLLWYAVMWASWRVRFVYCL
jgi:uncharacterized membrane protein